MSAFLPLQAPRQVQDWSTGVARPPERLALHEAAARYEIGMTVLRRAIEARRLPALRTGHLLWVRPADVAALGARSF